MKTRTDLIKEKLLSYAPQIKDNENFGALYNYVMQLSVPETHKKLGRPKKDKTQGSPPKKPSPTKVKQEKDTQVPAYLSKINLVIVEDENDAVDSSSSSSMPTHVSTTSPSTTSMSGNTLRK